QRESPPPVLPAAVAASVAGVWSQAEVEGAALGIGNGGHRPHVEAAAGRPPASCPPATILTSTIQCGQGLPFDIPSPADAAHPSKDGIPSRPPTPWALPAIRSALWS